MRRLSLLAFTLLISCSAREIPRESEPLPAGTVASTLTKAFALRPIAVGGSMNATFPTRANGALRVGTGDAWIDVSPLGARDVPCVEESGVTTCIGAFVDADVAYVREEGRVEDLRLARTRAAAARSAWSLRLGPAIAFVRIKDGHVEAVDRDGVVRLATEPAWAVDAKGTRSTLSLRLEGTTLEGTLDATELAIPIAIDPAWTAQAPMSTGRVLHRAVKLANGKVLVVGGSSPTGDQRTAEIYTPSTNTWAAVDLPLHDNGDTSNPGQVKLHYTQKSAVVAFAAGTKVVLAGGSTGKIVSPEFDVYDQATGLITKVVPGPGFGRGNSTAVALDGNKVAFIGGSFGSFTYTERVTVYEIWGPAILVSEVMMNRPEIDVSAVRLPDGKVFYSGGRENIGGSLTQMSDHAFLWDPTNTTASPLRVASMPTKRSGHASVHVPGLPGKAGKVVLFGGELEFGDNPNPQASGGSIVYDLDTSSWSRGPAMTAVRTFFAWSKLADGRTLISGGGVAISATFTSLTTAEIFDPVKMTFYPAGPLTAPRSAHQQVTLNDGTAFATGGVSGANEGFLEIVGSTEKFTIQAAALRCNDGGECLSGFCADGVCCNTACTGQCEACDVTGKVGTCSPVTDRPHGTRALCETRADAGVCDQACNGVDVTRCNFPGATRACGTAACTNGTETHASTCDGAGKCSDVAKSCGDFVCDATACKTVCASKADCSNPNHFCENGKCLPVLPAGSVCASDAACATGNCIDGTCCETKCDGQCQACDVPGQAGKCVPIKGKPHGARTACEANATDACESKTCDGSDTTKCAAKVGPCSGGFACDAVALACKSSCAGAADCAKGYECNDGKCVPATSKCSSDLTETIATDGTKSKCAPLLCRDGVCISSCKSSNDCQGGFNCDPSGTCVATSAAAPPADEGGCVYGARGTSGVSHISWVGAAIAGLLALRARRRRA